MITTAVDVTADSTITAASLVQAAGSGTTTLRDDVTTSAAEGVDVSTAQVVLDGLSITATRDGIVHFDAPVALTDEVVIDAGGAIRFASTVTSPDDMAKALTLESGTNILFEDAVGSGTGNALGAITIIEAVEVEAFGTIDAASLVQTAGSGTTSLYADVTTSAPAGVDLATARVGLDVLTITTTGGGIVRFDAPVELTGDAAIDAAGTIGFEHTVISPGGTVCDLTLGSDGHVIFRDTVGAGPANALGDITITRVVDVEAFGGIVADSLVQLGGSGTTTLHEDVTTGTAAGVDLTTAKVVLDGLAITASWEGVVRFDAPVELTGDTVIDAAGDISFLATLVSPDSTARSLTLGSNANISFQAAVGSGPDNALGAIAISQADSVEAFGEITAASLVQSSGSGTTTLHGDVATSDAAGVDLMTATVVLDGCSIATTGRGLVRFAAAVELTEDVVITAAGPISFLDTVGSPGGAAKALTLASDADILLQAAVGAGAGEALGPIAITQAHDVEALGTIDADSLVQLAGAGTTTLHADVTTSAPEGVDLTAAHTVLDGPNITTDGLGIVRFDGPVDLTGDVSIAAAGAITFAGPLVSSDGGAKALSLASDANIDFHDSVGAGADNELGAITITTAVDVTADSAIVAASLVQLAGSGSTLLQDNVTSSAPEGVDLAAAHIVLDGLSIAATGGGLVRCGGPVDLTGPVDIDAEGTITFENELVSSDGAAQTLTLASDANIDFHAAVGAGPDNQLGAITITIAVDVTADGTIEAASLVQPAGSGTTTLRNDVTTTGDVGVDMTANQIVLDGVSPDGLHVVNPDGGLLRFNGPVGLWSEVLMDTTGGDILFTTVATIDGEAGENNGLALTAAAGSVRFNANIGETVPIGQLAVTQADAGVTFGGSGQADDGPVIRVRTDGGINIGSAATITGGIVLNGGAGDTIAVVTAGAVVRFNGPVELWSDALVDTSDAGSVPGAEIRFTGNTPLDSQDGENNDLTLDAGTDGTVSFNADIGMRGALGQLVVHDALGVAFGNDADLTDPDLAPVISVRVDGDLDPQSADAFDINIGSAARIGEGGITLNAGDGNTIAFTTTADKVRFNGSVELQSHVLIDSSDAGLAAGAEIRFTLYTTIDSQADEHNDLILTGGSDGAVSFNADIGARDSLRRLAVTAAKDVAFGNDPVVDDLGLVTRVCVDGVPLQPDVWAVDLGSVAPIGDGGIKLNAGDGNEIALTTTSDKVRLNGAVELQSHVLIDTSDMGQEAGAEVRFTANAPVDSQADENNRLTLTAGTDGAVSFNADIGTGRAPGQLIVSDAYRVAFGNDSDVGDPDLHPVTTVWVDGDLDPLNQDAYDIDVGSGTAIGAGGIVLNGGDEQPLSFFTTADRVRFSGAVELQGDALIDTSGAGIEPAGADILVEGTVDGAGGEAAKILSLVSHAGTITVTGTVGGAIPLGVLSLQDDVSASTGPAEFEQDVYMESLITVGRPYAVALLGGGMITGATEFLNTGGVTLGDDPDDSLTFGDGVTSTASVTSTGGNCRDARSGHPVGNGACHRGYQTGHGRGDDHLRGNRGQCAGRAHGFGAGGRMGHGGVPRQCRGGLGVEPLRRQHRGVRGGGQRRDAGHGVQGRRWNRPGRRGGD
jgi:hypothetical protein